MVLKLRGLDPKASYRLTSVEGPAVPDRLFTGEELMTVGFRIQLHQGPAAAVVKYSITA
jgi:hypothetical protein